MVANHIQFSPTPESSLVMRENAMVVVKVRPFQLASHTDEGEKQGKGEVIADGECHGG
jgi:hypothetical protein